MKRFSQAIVGLAELCETFGNDLQALGDWLIGLLPTCGKQGCMREEAHKGKHADEAGRQWWGSLGAPREKYETPTLTPLCSQTANYLSDDLTTWIKEDETTNAHRYHAKRACSLPKDHFGLCQFTIPLYFYSDHADRRCQHCNGLFPKEHNVCPDCNTYNSDRSQ